MTRVSAVILLEFVIVTFSICGEKLKKNSNKKIVGGTSYFKILVSYDFIVHCRRKC